MLEAYKYSSYNFQMRYQIVALLRLTEIIGSIMMYGLNSTNFNNRSTLFNEYLNDSTLLDSFIELKKDNICKDFERVVRYINWQHMIKLKDSDIDKHKTLLTK